MSSQIGAEIGVIGGSGLYRLGLLERPERVTVSTPYGEPSAPVVVGELAGRRVAFIARHGEGHRFTPTEVPARANIYALRTLGVRQLIGVNAVGSLREEFSPGELVVPDQLLDRTSGQRPSTFFGEGLVAHVSMAEPFCPTLRHGLLAAARETGATAHDGGTYLCIEGPRFATRAESRLYQSWGAGVIGMTAVPEALLAREAQLCYAGMALVTDYDCWRDGPENVTADLVAEVMRRNVDLAVRVLAQTAGGLDPALDCACRHALDGAILTAPEAITPELRKRFGLLLP